MDIRELDVSIKEGELAEEVEYEEEDDPAVDLQNALLLLRDAGELLSILANKNAKRWPAVINHYIGRQIVKLGQEIEAFTVDFEMGDDPPSNVA